MSVDDKIFEDIKLAMKAGEKNKVETLRTLRAQIKDARIAKGEELDDQDMIKVLLNAAKKRKEAIEFYQKANRNDLIERESFQLELIHKYLPEQLSQQEIKTIIDSAIKELNITSEKDFGRLMGLVMQKVKGKADGKIVQLVAKEALSDLV